MSSTLKIESANSGGRFTEAELRAKVAQSKRFWSSPQGRARQARLDAEARNRKPSPTRFPDLAKRAKAGDTRPHLSAADSLLLMGGK